MNGVVMAMASKGSPQMVPIEELPAELERRQQFMMMVAHEMRNLLAPLTCGVELLASADAKAAISVRPMMARQVAQMTRLVDDLLDVAGSAPGRMSLYIASVDLYEVIAAAIEIAQPAIAARQHRLSLALDPPGPAIVHGDQCRLTQIVSNLLLNAAKFTSNRGDIYVVLERETSYVKVCVRDTGVGMAPDMLANIFDAYVHSHRVPDSSRSGLGLGLAVARHLVELHGGTLHAHSAGPGCGSEFVLRLPVAD
jgi:signal transduction histidine kinase